MTDQPVSTEPLSRRRDPEARPQQILDAAFHEFGERGLAGARLDDIAKRAGVAKGTIYLYFPNKEALFREMVHTTIVQALDDAEAQRDEWAPQESAEALCRRLGTNWWRFLRTDRVMTLNRLVAAELRQFPDLVAFYADEVIARGRRLVADIIELGIRRGEFRQLDTMIAARMYSAIWISHAMWAANRGLHASLGDDDQILHEMLEFYLSSLRPTAP